MKKRIIACILCLASVFSLFALSANAAVLEGVTSKVDYDNTDPDRYYVEIDINNQIITVYDLKANNKVVLQSLCTTGNRENPTGAGTYKMGALKERFGYFVQFGQYAQYWSQVVRGIYIHSVMYDSKSLSSMSKSAYNNLGKNVSHGCVRVLPHVAQWIFYNCPPGTTCKVTTSKPDDPQLKKALKGQIPTYSSYAQPKDAKPDPQVVPAAVKVDSAPLRTGFSTSRDTTVTTLKLNEKVLLLQIAQDWCKVSTSSGKLGYVKTQYLMFSPNESVQFGGGYRATQQTYLYESMSTDAKKLATIASKADVKVTASPKTGWYSAEVGGVSGYVRSKYVQSYQAYVYPDASMSFPAQLKIKPGIAANFRDGPGTAYAVVGSLSAGAEVTALSRQGDWYYCSYMNTTGYLHISCFAN